MHYIVDNINKKSCLTKIGIVGWMTAVMEWDFETVKHPEGCQEHLKVPLQGLFSDRTGSI